MTSSDFLFKKRFRIPTTRLQSWDYSSSGYYFITICTYQKKEYFGEIHNGKMELSVMGKVAQTYWKEIPKHFPFVTLDEFVIMPNHVHGIVIIQNKRINNVVNNVCRDVINHVSTHKQITPMGKNSLGEIIRWFKGICTHHIHNQLKLNFHWQSRYYDHIIRTEHEFHSIREYIRYNPLKWDEDEENPINRKPIYG